MAIVVCDIVYLYGVSTLIILREEKIKHVAEGNGPLMQMNKLVWITVMADVSRPEPLYRPSVARSVLKIIGSSVRLWGIYASKTAE